MKDPFAPMIGSIVHGRIHERASVSLFSNDPLHCVKSVHANSLMLVISHEPLECVYDNSNRETFKGYIKVLSDDGVIGWVFYPNLEEVIL